MKKLTLALALFAFVGTASVNAAVKHEGEKTEKSEKKAKKSKKDKHCAPGEAGEKKSCCAKKEAKA